GVIRTIFMAAAPITDLAQKAVQISGNWMQHVLPASLLTSLIVDGAWKGVGGMLEYSGYLARAALIADRTMARVGLQGKSFIPLLSAYGCAVPAIMATR